MRRYFSQIHKKKCYIKRLENFLIIGQKVTFLGDLPLLTSNYKKCHLFLYFVYVLCASFSYKKVITSLCLFYIYYVVHVLTCTCATWSASYDLLKFCIA